MVQKAAEKEALKAKKERIKASKPKKSDQGNIFVRIWKAIRKFFKDFKGTCKKVVWPDRKTVIKNSLVVLATVLIVGVGIWIVDFALTRGIQGVRKAITNVGEARAEEESASLAAEAGDDAAAQFVNPAAQDSGVEAEPAT